MNADGRLMAAILILAIMARDAMPVPIDPAKMIRAVLATDTIVVNAKLT